MEGIAAFIAICCALFVFVIVPLVGMVMLAQWLFKKTLGIK